MNMTPCYACLIAIFCCVSPAIADNKKPTPVFAVEYQKFKLDNGLEVVFHLDRSDPVVAVNLTAHVGSAREKTGRTGFAHLFEHLLFLESEHLGKGGLDKMSARIGGSGANGSTSRDRTNYLQTVPKDALEKMLWAEADKLGWFINTVTKPVLEKEKQVVKNEKRQSSDNAPYGHNNYVIDKNLYPSDHPYHWQVIGSLADLQAATLDDVKQFFKRWYVPNNVTLTLAGDFDPVQAKQWVIKYFGEIKPGAAIAPLEKRPAVLTETKKRYHVDNFANLPQITRVYPTVEQYHPDSYALNVLFEFLSVGKSSPLYKVLVEQQKLAPSASMYHLTSELAGQVYLSSRAYAGIDLDQVNQSIDAAFAVFEKEGMSQQALQRILATQETQFYNRLSSVLGKGAQLAYYNIYTGDPGYATQEIQAILAVTIQDVKRVYEKYIKDQHYVVTSFIPKTQLDLAVSGSSKAKVTEEQVIQGAEKQVALSSASRYDKTPSTFDRSKEPPYGESADAVVPSIWRANLDDLQVLGINVNEVPLVDIEVVIDGGQLLESPAQSGVTNLLARMLMSGTKNKSPEALEQAIKNIGASINISARTEDIRIRINTLAKHFDQALALVTEILLEPRWDKKEFALLKQQTLAQLLQQQANPRSIANNTFNQLLYGETTARGSNILGTRESVTKLSMQDLKTYYQTKLAIKSARVHVVGAVNKPTVVASLTNLHKLAPSSKVAPARAKNAPSGQPAKVYFYDIPNAKQTIVNIGNRALAATDKDFYPANIMNYRLGGGSFASQLTQVLREGKGYTYGIFSRFTGTKDVGTFRIFSQIRSNVTLEAAVLIKDIVDNYAPQYSQQDLATSQSFLIKSNARAFETARAKLGLLDNISRYDWAENYVKQRENIVKNITVEDIKALASKYLNSQDMIWLFVGDAKTQLPRLTSLGLGKPTLLNAKIAQ